MVQDEYEEKVTLLTCEHHETLLSDAIPDKFELWAMAHNSVTDEEDEEVCRPELYEIYLSTLKEELELENYKTDF